ncbi:MAG: FprA family A-type flavoprotein, partial [Duncaniella sp.]|nr:FprA family A-type flavoprotein [Duncaniella sp.]
CGVALLVLCSVTYDGMLFPAMYNFLHHLDAKKLQRRRVALVENGSWAPTAARNMNEQLSKMKDMTVVSPVLTLNSRLHTEDAPTITALVKSLMEG